MEDKDMYEKMKKELLEALKDMLADSFKVKTYTVFKNGKEAEAFLITEEDSAVSPTFYYKNYLDDYMKGVSVEDFIFSGLLMWLMERIADRKLWVQMLSMLLGMVTYYIVGTVWFMFVYGNTNGPVSLLTALGWCVFPFVVPDLVKAALALSFGNALRKPLARLV